MNAITYMSNFFVFLIVASIGKKLRAHLSLEIVEKLFNSKQYKFTSYVIIFGEKKCLNNTKS